jgi:hypothetical protein
VSENAAHLLMIDCANYRTTSRLVVQLFMTETEWLSDLTFGELHQTCIGRMIRH